MSKKKKVIMVGALAGLLLFGVTTVGRADVSFKELVARFVANDVRDEFLKEIVGTPEVEVLEVSEDTPFVAGAQSGPDTFFPQECHQGVCHGYVKNPLTATSTSFCVLRNPLKSTSTILSFTMNISGRGAQIGAQTFDVSTTTAVGAYGSSTPALIYARSLAANINDNVAWTPHIVATGTTATLTNFVVDSDTFNGSNPISLAPNAYITARWATATPATVSSGVSGTCSAVFQEI